ncbi:MAG: hypothetical protein Q9Q40_00420 [Acidobacteriota bacterium]|nr:hypothetical protein [Acidobacteriota bacterium]
MDQLFQRHRRVDGRSTTLGRIRSDVEVADDTTRQDVPWVARNVERDCRRITPANLTRQRPIEPTGPRAKMGHGLGKVAALEGDPREVLFADDVGPQPDPPKEYWREAACGFYWTEGPRGLGWTPDAVPTLKGGSSVGIPSPPAIVMPDGCIVTPDIRDAERLQGFEAGWTQPAEEIKKPGFRWRLVGNAVTVDAAAWIGERLIRPGADNDVLDLPLRKAGSWPTAAWNMGEGRMIPVGLSEWPLARPRAPLAEFLPPRESALGRSMSSSL